MLRGDSGEVGRVSCTSAAWFPELRPTPSWGSARHPRARGLGPELWEPSSARQVPQEGGEGRERTRGLCGER